MRATTMSDPTSVGRCLEEPTAIAMKMYFGAYTRRYSRGTDCDLWECKNFFVGSKLHVTEMHDYLLPRYWDIDPRRKKRRNSIIPKAIAGSSLAQQLLYSHVDNIIEVDEQATSDPLQQLEIAIVIYNKIVQLYQTNNEERETESEEKEKVECEWILASIYSSFNNLCVYSSIYEVDCALSLGSS